MNNLRDIRNHLRRVRQIQKVTRAMKMVSAVKLRHSQAALFESRPYLAAVRDTMLRLAGHRELASIGHPFLVKRPVKRTLFLVISTDKGLCGSVNSNLYRLVDKTQKELAVEWPEAKDRLFYLVGRKASDYYRRRQDRIPGFHMVDHMGAAEADALAIAKRLSEMYIRGDVDRIDVFYTKFKSTMQQQSTHERILPVARDAEERAQGAAGGKAAADYIFEPDAAAVLADVATRFIGGQVQRVILESIASEHGARMTMMDQATNNADDMIGQIQLQYNKARQLGITRELADITTGAEAMS